MSIEKQVPFFTLTDVRKGFGSRVVLDGITLAIPDGKTTVVLGGSGAGKSVLLKHLNGLIRPDSGSVMIGEEEIAHLPERELLKKRARIGILFQDGALFDSMTVAENVAFPLVEKGVREKGELENAVEEVLARVGLSGEGEKFPANLSGGMKKRAALARAMVTKPACLLCDEPTAGLDPLLSESISIQIRELTRENEMTSVVVTHDLAAMELVADHVVFLKDGIVLFEGSPDELATCGESAVEDFLSARGGGG